MEQFADICKNLALPLSVPLQLFIVAWLVVIDRRTTRSEAKIDRLLQNGKTTSPGKSESVDH